MTTIRLLPNKSWLVCWLLHETECRITEFEDALSAETFFKLEGHVSTYKLSLTGIDRNEPTLELALEIADEDFPDEDCPSSVTAVLGDRIVDLYSTETAKWGSVDIYSKSCNELFTLNAIFYILIDFRAPKTGEQRVIDRLSNLLESQTMADVHFVVKGQEIGAHSAIVISAIPIVAAMFEQFNEGQPKRVVIDDVEPEVFKQVLHYIYTGKAPKLHEQAMAEQLLLAADKYEVEGLKAECESHLIYTMNMENVVKSLVLAHLHSAANLMEAAMKLLSANKQEVWQRVEWKELARSHPDLFFLASRRMAS